MTQEKYTPDEIAFCYDPAGRMYFHYYGCTLCNHEQRSSEKNPFSSFCRETCITANKKSFERGIVVVPRGVLILGMEKKL